jgi:hypothetical protein
VDFSRRKAAAGVALGALEIGLKHKQMIQDQSILPLCISICLLCVQCQAEKRICFSAD